ncbi:MAG: hypothetical protein IAE80_00560 [Anaerolinea sp.]|nr:hypothetical protein [Anaerolinea sp.]
MLSKSQSVKKEAARQLIREKQYEQARALLDGIDEPEVNQWRARLNLLIPQPPRPARTGGALRGCVSYVLKAVGAIALAGAIWFGWGLLASPFRDPFQLEITGILLAIAVVSWSFGRRFGEP